MPTVGLLPVRLGGGDRQAPRLLVVCDAAIRATLEAGEEGEVHSFAYNRRVQPRDGLMAFHDLDDALTRFERRLDPRRAIANSPAIGRERGGATSADAGVSRAGEGAARRRFLKPADAFCSSMPEFVLPQETALRRMMPAWQTWRLIASRRDDPKAAHARLWGGSEGTMTPRSEERSPSRHRSISTMPVRDAIDWSTHFRAVIDDLKSMQCSAERRDEDPDLLTLVLWMRMRMRRVALRLRSRHIPQAARARFSQIPWQGIAAWLAREEALERTAPERLRRDQALIDFARTARSLIAPIRDLQGELAMTSADGNGRDGVLVWDQRAPFVHVALHVPEDCADLILAALERAYQGIEAPTPEGVRTALATISDALTALGVRQLRLIGSVARGTATPASHVDLLYEAAPAANVWHVWCDLLALLERTFGRVVDLHEAARMPTRSRAGAITVWQRERSRRRSRTTTAAERRARSVSGEPS